MKNKMLLLFALMLAGCVPCWNPLYTDAIAHRITFDDQIILTASTSELQKFILEHVNEEEFFGGAMELKRKAPPF